MSHPDDSVTQWIDGLKAGDEAAAAKLWRRYFQRLMKLANKKLGDHPRRAADEEDVAISAFHSLCHGAKDDRFPDIRDRDDLWRLVVCITERKAYTHLRDQKRHKRGSGLVLGESALIDHHASSPGGIEQVPGPEPTPEFAAEMVEAVNELINQLADDQLRQIALLKMEGYSNREIAGKIGRAVTTVERRLRLIRKTWRQEVGDA